MPLISRRLQGWLHSVHTVAFKADGTFYVDLHDFNPEGTGDYAWTVYVLPDAVPGLRSKFESAVGRAVGSQDEFLDALAERFESSRALLNWLEAEGVQFEKRFDPWAAADPDDGP